MIAWTAWIVAFALTGQEVPVTVVDGVTGAAVEDAEIRLVPLRDREITSATPAPWGLGSPVEWARSRGRVLERAGNGVVLPEPATDAPEWVMAFANLDERFGCVIFETETPPASLSFEVYPRRTLRVRAIDASGEPVPGARLSYLVPEGRGRGEITLAPTGGDGATELPDLDWRLALSAERTQSIGPTLGRFVNPARGMSVDRATLRGEHPECVVHFPDFGRVEVRLQGFSTHGTGVDVFVSFRPIGGGSDEWQWSGWASVGAGGVALFPCVEVGRELNFTWSDMSGSDTFAGDPVVPGPVRRGETVRVELRRDKTRVTIVDGAEHFDYDDDGTTYFGIEPPEILAVPLTSEIDVVGAAPPWGGESPVTWARAHGRRIERDANGRIDLPPLPVDGSHQELLVAHSGERAGFCRHTVADGNAISFELFERRSLTVRVVDASGSPVIGFPLRLEFGGHDWGASSDARPTDRDGRWILADLDWWIAMWGRPRRGTAVSHSSVAPAIGFSTGSAESRIDLDTSELSESQPTRDLRVPDSGRLSIRLRGFDSRSRGFADVELALRARLSDHEPFREVREVAVAPDGTASFPFVEVGAEIALAWRRANGQWIDLPMTGRETGPVERGESVTIDVDRADTPIAVVDAENLAPIENFEVIDVPFGDRFIERNASPPWRDRSPIDWARDAGRPIERGLDGIALPPLPSDSWRWAGVDLLFVHDGERFATVLRRPGSTSGGVFAVLRPRRDLHVAVIDAAGAPIAGVPLCVIVADRERAASLESHPSAADGSWVLRDVDWWMSIWGGDVDPDHLTTTVAPDVLHSGTHSPAEIRLDPKSFELAVPDATMMIPDCALVTVRLRGAAVERAMIDLRVEAIDKRTGRTIDARPLPITSDHLASFFAETGARLRFRWADQGVEDWRSPPGDPTFAGPTRAGDPVTIELDLSE